MTSYLVLTPPGGPDRDHRSTVFVADRFSWLALIFPWVWLLAKRLWLTGIAVLILQGASGWLMQVPGFGPAGWLAGFAISLLVAFEGRHYYAEMLIRRGWTLDRIVSAADQATAEEIYFSDLPEPERKALPDSKEWARQVSTAPAGVPAGGWRPAFGLFDHEGGR